MPAREPNLALYIPVGDAECALWVADVRKFGVSMAQTALEAGCTDDEAKECLTILGVREMHELASLYEGHDHRPRSAARRKRIGVISTSAQG